VRVIPPVAYSGHFETYPTIKPTVEAPVCDADALPELPGARRRGGVARTIDRRSFVAARRGSVGLAHDGESPPRGTEVSVGFGPRSGTHPPCRRWVLTTFARPFLVEASAVGARTGVLAGGVDRAPDATAERRGSCSAYREGPITAPPGSRTIVFHAGRYATLAVPYACLARGLRNLVMTRSCSMASEMRALM
jgi:hypothetical protein